MAKFASQTSHGEAVYHAIVEPRARVHFDKSALRLIRARTFAACQTMGMSLPLIAATYNFCTTTVKTDLAWLRDQRAAGLDHLPHERRDADDDAA